MKLKLIVVLIFFPILIYAQWTQCAGPEGGYVNAIINQGSNIFVGTSFGGIFRSTDNCNSWTTTNNGLANKQILSFTLNGANLFAGTASSGVYLSTDSGNTWNSMSNGLPSNYVHTLVTKGSTVFAGAGGVFKSNDNGVSWISCNVGLPSAGINCLFVSGNNLFVGTAGSGVYISTDDGASWTAINNNSVGNYPQSFTQNGNTIFLGTLSGLFKTDNNGTTWTYCNAGITSPNIYSLAQIGGVVFAGTEKGLFKSTDNGDTWTGLNVDSAHTIILSLHYNGNDFFAGSNGGMYLSPNNGITWNKKNNGLIATHVFKLFNSGYGVFAGTSAGVFFTNDHGNSWSERTTGTVNADVRSFEKMGSKLFMGTYQTGFYLSNDSGRTWIASNSGMNTQSHQVLALTKDSAELYAGTDNSVYLSLDSGNTWTRPSGLSFQNSVKSIIAVGQNIYAGASIISVSYDDAASWSQTAGSPFTDNNDFLLKGSELYAATGLGILFYDTIASSWISMNNGIPSATMSMASAGNILFTGTDNDGVFLSYDNATSWTSLNIGLTNLKVNSMAVEGNYIYAGTFGNGVFVNSTTTNLTSIENHGAEVLLIPNPVSSENRFCNILSINKFDNACISIINLQGKLIQSKKNITGNNYNLNINEIPSGIYLLKILNEGVTQIKKLIIQ